MRRVKPFNFESRWHAADANLRAEIVKLTWRLEEHEQKTSPRTRRRKLADQQKFERAVEAVCCNLSAIAISGIERPLAVRLGNYASQVSDIYGKHFNRVIDLMTELGLVTKKTGNSFSRSARTASTIQPTDKLAEHLPIGKLKDWNALRLADHRDFISLSRAKENGEDDGDTGQPAPERLTAATERWLAVAAKQMTLINGSLQRGRIEGHPRGVIHAADIPGSITDTLMTPHHRTVWRVFNGTYAQGGRLFGGFWETLPRPKRFIHIKIAGDPVVNVDYGQLFLRLAYARSKINPPPGDLYDLTGSDCERRDWKRLREGRKKLVNALISNTGALNQWPGRTTAERAEVRACFPRGTRPSEAIRAIKERHRAIAAEWFENGRGLELMRVESDLLVAVLIRLIAMDITALPLHDSVIVARKHASAAKRIMLSEASRQTGTRIPVKIDSGASV